MAGLSRWGSAETASSVASADDGDLDAQKVADVTTWLRGVFEAVGKEVPEFEYTPGTLTHLHNLAVLSQQRTQSASIVAADLRQRATEFRSQAATILETLECAGLSQENLSQSGVMSANTLANVANLLDLKDTESTSYLMAIAELSIKKTELEETRSKAQRESKMLLDYTRKAIARLTYLKRALGQLEEEAALREGPMTQWNTNLKMMASKERQYLQQLANYKSLLRRLGYTREISHGVLMAMVEHRLELEAKTKPILDTLRSYQDLPPDKALAGLAIEDKRCEYEAAEKYLEDALHSALHAPPD